MSDDSTAPADLSSLGLDLTEMFRPSWTKEGGQPADASSLASSFTDEEGDRPRHGGRGPRRDERSVRDRSPRPERSGGDRDRGPRRDARGGPRGKESGRRDDRGPRRHEERAPREPVAPPSVLEGWNLELIPEPAAIEGIAKQVRSRAKAYPLFELSRLILKLSDRYSVKLTPLSGETHALFRAKLDGSLWNSRKEAVDHLLTEHLGKFYRRTTVATEPPKGAFTVVAQCGMSGVLLGPPNHHEYTSKVIALHGSKFRNMPFEVFKSRIKMVRDEALIEQWKTEQSTKTVYTPVMPGEEEQVASAAVAENEPIAEVTAVESPVSSETTDATTGATIHTEETAQATEETAPESSAPSEEAAPVETESAPSHEEGAEPSETPVADSSSEKKGLSFEQITADFLANHADMQIEPVSGVLSISGRVALHGSTKLLRELLLRHLRELDRFPLTLAQAVGKELTSQGLQLFKSHKKIIHVSMARPRYLDRQNTPISESFKAILEYLEAHPNQRRDKQWNALLAIRTGIPLRPAKTEPVEIAQTEETDAATATSSSTPAISDDEVKKHEQSLGADLLWLLHQGHVIDFAMGNLQAATPPKPQPQKKEKAAPVSEEASLDETLAGDADAVQTSEMPERPAEKSEDAIHEPAAHHESPGGPESTRAESVPPQGPGQVLPN